MSLKFLIACEWTHGKEGILLRHVLDLPHVVCDELRVVELVVPVGGATVQIVVVFVLSQVLEF